MVTRDPKSGFHAGIEKHFSHLDTTSAHPGNLSSRFRWLDPLLFFSSAAAQPKNTSLQEEQPVHAEQNECGGFLEPWIPTAKFDESEIKKPLCF